MVDGVACADTVISGLVTYASSLDVPNLQAGPHIIAIQPSLEAHLVRSVAVFVPVGTVLLIEVTPPDCAGEKAREVAVKIRLLEGGFAHNGWWGRRWARRLGWPVPGSDSAGVGR